MTLNAGIIDLFAGPGGLGEGFSAFAGPDGHRPFHISMSVEKEPSAHRTLQGRAFFRQFGEEVPVEYYDFLKGVIDRDTLYQRYPEQATTAIEETLCRPRALGDEGDDRVIHARMRKLKRQSTNPWIVIGGPPCQAYSLVGRARNRGVSGYKAENDHRHFLYEEYLMALDIMKPAVFVMENVKGLLSSTVAGERIFDRIREDLANPGKALGKKRGKRYRLYSLVPGMEHVDLYGEADVDWLIRCERFGVPQARHRVILVGVRDDIQVEPESLRPTGSTVLSSNVLHDLPRIRSGLSREADSPSAWHNAVIDAAEHVSQVLKGSKGLMREIGSRAGKIITRGAHFSRYPRKFAGGDTLGEWLRDERLGGFVNHQSRGHAKRDLARYLYCSTYASLHEGSSPRLNQFPVTLAPNHKNWRTGKFADRFKVQSGNRPSSTVTSHISKDGHYYIHYDPVQCRSLTVREAARLQTFPDNYFFEGNRTQQYVQVGNAVPPWLAKQIAKVVYQLLG